MPRKNEGIVPRREFLLLSAAGAGGIALATFTYTATAITHRGTSAGSMRDGRYRETDHIRTFYRVNRYAPNAPR